MTDREISNQLASEYEAAVERKAPGATLARLWARYLDARLREHDARRGDAA